MWDILQKNVRGLSPKADSVRTLHEQVLLDLTQRFAGPDAVSTSLEGSPGIASGASSPDLVIPQGRRVAVVEIKIGNPELPLPSSTSSQMRLLCEQARRSFSEDVIPVLVTNYSVTPDDRKEFEHEGIKIVPVASALSRYDRQQFSREFAEIVGLTPTPASIDASL